VSGKGPFDPRKEAHLLSGFVDGELDSEDEARVRAYLEENAAAREQVEELKKLNELTGHLRLKEAPPEAWEGFWNGVYNRAERSLGWILFAIGALITGGWLGVQLALALVESPDLPFMVKAAVFVLAGGLLTLVVSVVRERLYARRHTRYKDVHR
jgi:anti-sigma factor RsiW